LWVRPGGNTIAVPQVFKGRWGASRMPRRLGHPASRPALSPSESIPGLSGRVPRRTRATVREEREPSSGPPPASLGSLALPRRSVPRHGSGILTRFPFGQRCDPPPSLAERPGCVGHARHPCGQRDMTRAHETGYPRTDLQPVLAGSRARLHERGVELPGEPARRRRAGRCRGRYALIARARGRCWPDRGTFR
jgi:hypothetical protein